MPGYIRKLDLTDVPRFKRSDIGLRAQHRAQVHAPVKTGHLRRNIGWRVRSNYLELGDLFGRVPYMRRQDLTHRTKSEFLLRGLELVKPRVERERRTAYVGKVRQALEATRAQRLLYIQGRGKLQVRIDETVR